MKWSIALVLVLITVGGLPFLSAAEGAEVVEPTIFKEGANQAFGRIAGIDRIARDIDIGNHRFHVDIGATLMGIGGKRLAFDELELGMKVGVEFRRGNPPLIQKLWIDGE